MRELDKVALAKLEEYEAQLRVIVDAKEREKETKELNAKAKRINEDNRLNQDSQGEDTVDVPPIEPADASKGYRAAKDILKAKYEYDITPKLGWKIAEDLSEAQVNLLKAYIENNLIVDAINFTSSLSESALPALMKDGVIFKKLTENLGVFDQEVKDALLVRAVALNDIGAVRAAAYAGAVIKDKELKVVFEQDWHIDKDTGQATDFAVMLAMKVESVSGATLASAVKNGALPVVLANLASKTSAVNMKSALQEAVEKGNTQVATILLNKGAEASYNAFQGGDTLLIRAIKNGSNNELIDLLIKTGIVNDQGNEGVTALQTAVMKGNAEIIQKLIDNGAKVNATDVEGKTALHSAVEAGNAGLVKTLLMNGANIHISERALGETISKASEAAQADIKNLFKIYLAMEKDFKEKFVPHMKEAMKGNENMEGALDKALQATYGTDKSFKTILADSGFSTSQNLDEKFKLGYIEELVISLVSFFEAKLGSSGKTSQEIKADKIAEKIDKVAEKIYGKIQDTPEFKALVAAPVAKAVSVVVDAVKIAKAEGVVGPEVVDAVEKTLSNEKKVLGRFTADVLHKEAAPSTDHGRT